MSSDRKINVLGTEYMVMFKNYSDDTFFSDRNCDGYCDDILHEIVICRMDTHPLTKNESKEYCEKTENAILRHEIIHAFLSESGLQGSSEIINIGWAKNEEMVDWIALQFHKIQKAFEECGVI